MSFLGFAREANVLARIEVLETRIAVLEGTLRQVRNAVAIHEGTLQALVLDKKANDTKEYFQKEAKQYRQREYARKYYQANKEAIKARKRGKRTVNGQTTVVNPNQLELPEMAVGGTA